MSTPVVEVIAQRALGGAPLGNMNRRKGKLYQYALEAALKRKPEALEAIADRAINDAAAGDAKARDHVVDRIDGPLAREITGPGGGPIQHQVLVVTVEMLEGADLTDDELDALERALPALAKLGIAGVAASVTAEAGIEQEAGRGAVED